MSLIPLEFEQIVTKTTEHVKNLLKDDCTGHDWWHTYRVSKLALHIAEKECANILVVSLAALLHDVYDWKFNATNDIKCGAEHARQWLGNFDLDNQIIDHVVEIISSIPFKGANLPDKLNSLEAMVVQDADRLDAIGAIGIARTFAYGGFIKRPLYDPNQPCTLHDSFEDYKNSNSSTINHFFEKLLLLKNRMHTATAQNMAEIRHNFMIEFAKQFLYEWNLEKSGLENFISLSKKSFN